ncbi:MBL fold metallo-hydrolase RNA specificity domain-containing protein [Dyadobacter fermentans]|uniref:Beta-lactamase domain protein n=1 Tax=Dyadobacter fermentans (strain ATCC 700827 / DSM 18053 / CIP 107007 / KCTC 52180 / NS114) TaxID=471854 RepID=C6VWR0_DYAFD|nr:MBL fold metallo-hydrolase [Dyadobacter fermentans]ACT96810.1 beta-lactamase domain protein [Dyadobacter fermentans DSM 18053]
MKLTFWGATQQVTGSMFLLESDDYRILIDCGSDFDLDEIGKKTRYEQQKSVFPFEPSLINTVLLTHAHIDHSGNIPNLYKEGFEGRVVCTEPTMALTSLLLKDAANLHQKRLNSRINSKKRSGKKKREVPMDYYVEKHVIEALDNFVPVAFGQRYRIADNVTVTYYAAGHLLGAAHIVLEVYENGEKKRLCFSGDIGRKNYPLLIDPQEVPQVDYLICESTYGNRLHEDQRGPVETLADVIKRTCIDIPGRLIIPSFSVGRTQALLYTLNQLYLDRSFPFIKVFSDSPLAHSSTKVYQKHARMLNKEAREFKEDNDMLFDFENLIYLESSDASRAVSNYNEPCIIISSSGMVQGGRVEAHVEANIGNPYATILMIGYASEGTLGWRLLNGQDTISIRGKQHPVLANVEKIDVFSGHGDQNDLINFVKMQDPEKLKGIFLVHGEQQSMAEFQSKIQEIGYHSVETPLRGTTYEL